MVLFEFFPTGREHWWWYESKFFPTANMHGMLILKKLFLSDSAFELGSEYYISFLDSSSEFCFKKKKLFWNNYF